MAVLCANYSDGRTGSELFRLPCCVLNQRRVVCVLHSQSPVLCSKLCVTGSRLSGRAVAVDKINCAKAVVFFCPKLPGDMLHSQYTSCFGQGFPAVRVASVKNTSRRINSVRPKAERDFTGLGRGDLPA